ncbi:hypothetical protein H6P81_021217 [Aristolochia fimbriata]|uniref:Uncharacterized protein n=1 Tax=Aristolochia fimbriata TaxID=158543 RepID=A0AAV7DTM0_ARIFI|nr:hypothetical protein H6P81_021217 [Aristolochia fimbriata]
MKNVAKCDTWCELQNPANHRVFERKLHPRPLGQGYTCLGVTPDVFSPHPAPAAPPRAVRRVVGGEQIGRPCPPWRGWLKNTLPQGHFGTTSGGSALPGPAWLGVVSEALALKRTPAGSCLRGPRPCSDWHPRSGGNTR